MKYIKRIDEFFGLFKSVEDKLKEFGIKNYTINNDGTVDVDDSISFFGEHLTKIPFRFGIVTGNFHINGNKLKSLEGCPKEVGGFFDCGYNQLKDLIGGPQKVEGDYYCINNQLTSLEGCAGDIGLSIHCRYNNLDLLDCSSVINGDVFCNGNGFKEEPEFFGICDKIIWK